MNNIFYHIEALEFIPDEWVRTVAWLKECINNENKSCGTINYIFCSDAYLLEINKQYLNHNTYTDVITFDYVQGSIISGDVFISIERVKENANQYQITFQKEFLRVLVHALLHLMGYDDQSSAEAKEIRAKEDFYLNLHSQK